MDYVLVCDAARWATVLLTYFTAATLTRLVYTRVRDKGWRTDVYPSPFATSGIVVVLLLGSVRRLYQLGEDPDGWFDNVSLWLWLLALLLIAVGNLLTIRFSVPALFTGNRRYRDD